MKPLTLVGMLLLIVGVLALAYSGINYTRREKVLDIGPIHVTKESSESLPLPPLLGGTALIGGVSLLILGAKKNIS
jgi:hypothetical protein